MQSLNPFVPGADPAASHLAAPCQMGQARVPHFVHTHFLTLQVYQVHALGHAPGL